MPRRRVVVAMSGGVDSAVAAALLARDGWDVIGATLRLATCAGPVGSGGSIERDGDASAAAAARTLGISHVVLDAEERFGEQVLRRSWEEVALGRTPCPCAWCNRDVKLGLLLPWAKAQGATHVATGHYARTMSTEGPGLWRARDPERDQSWFLFALPLEVLGALLLPVGDHTKDEVRGIARRIGLPHAGRPDSQDACLGEAGVAFGESLRLRFGAEARPGRVLDRAGRVLGRHDGVHRFTIGQRRGLGLALGRPAWVRALRPDAAEIVLDTEVSWADALEATNATWQMPDPRGAFRCAVQVRSRHRAAEATVDPLPDGRFRVRFDAPQRAVTPGQPAVCYTGDRVLGGGWIAWTERDGERIG
ncbi:MAG: tRNA 2-thiouridine(34) synthase MnmA [Deltaproteobacteria bacterium]|nr:tRNA 2-thiouridine(34) synthase MnmA [Deltaproteobacteria bacterium]